MLKKFLILKRSRKELSILAAIFCALVTGAALIGVSDNMPGIVLCYLATAVPFVALTCTWRKIKRFLILMAASFAGFFVFVLLHNAFYALTIITSHITMLSRLMEGLHVTSFIVAIFICPIGFVVGAAGSAVLFIRRDKTMSWINDKVEKFRQVPNPYFFLHITARFLFGVGLGLLLATWLPIWTGWIFIVVALAISVPSARIILRK